MIFQCNIKSSIHDPSLKPLYPQEEGEEPFNYRAQVLGSTQPRCRRYTLKYAGM